MLIQSLISLIDATDPSTLTETLKQMDAAEYDKVKTKFKSAIKESILLGECCNSFKIDFGDVKKWILMERERLGGGDIVFLVLCDGWLKVYRRLLDLYEDIFLELLQLWQMAAFFDNQLLNMLVKVKMLLNEANYKRFTDKKAYAAGKTQLTEKCLEVCQCMDECALLGQECNEDLFKTVGSGRLSTALHKESHEMLITSRTVVHNIWQGLELHSGSHKWTKTDHKILQDRFTEFVAALSLNGTSHEIVFARFESFVYKAKNFLEQTSKLYTLTCFLQNYYWSHYNRHLPHKSEMPIKWQGFRVSLHSVHEHCQKTQACGRAVKKALQKCVTVNTRLYTLLNSRNTRT